MEPATRVAEESPMTRVSATAIAERLLAPIDAETRIAARDGGLEPAFIVNARSAGSHAMQAIPLAGLGAAGIGAVLAWDAGKKSAVATSAFTVVANAVALGAVLSGSAPLAAVLWAGNAAIHGAGALKDGLDALVLGAAAAIDHLKS